MLASVATSRLLPAAKRRVGGLCLDSRGAVMTEYVVLLGVCSIAISAAIMGLGPKLVANYERSQGILLAPFP